MPNRISIKMIDRWLGQLRESRTWWMDFEAQQSALAKQMRKNGWQSEEMGARRRMGRAWERAKGIQKRIEELEDKREKLVSREARKGQQESKAGKQESPASLAGKQESPAVPAESL